MSRSLLVTLALLALPTAASAQTRDPRFFGRYCGEASFQHCVNYRVCFFLGWPCFDQSRCDAVDLRGLSATVDYWEAANGTGLTEGHGTGTANGEPLVFNFGGDVRGPGVISGSMASNFFAPSRGDASLSWDGLALTVHAMGHAVTLRKDACGNHPPQVRLQLQPPATAELARGSRVRLEGSVVSDEDAAFAPQRLTFSSDRDGLLRGLRTDWARGATLTLNTLSPGRHVLTFTATDSNGLSGTATTTVVVSNTPPQVPTLLSLPPAGVLMTGGQVLFQAFVRDREDGLLAGDSVVWSLSQDGEHWRELGRGTAVRTTLPEPGGYTLKVTAVDSAGERTETKQRLEVRPNGGNLPPRVSIVSPAPKDCGRVPAGQELLLSGELHDPQEPVGQHAFAWRVERLTPQRPVLVFEEDSAQSSVVLDAVDGLPTWYRLAFTARDSHGLVGEASTTVQVVPASNARTGGDE